METKRYVMRVKRGNGRWSRLVSMSSDNLGKLKSAMPEDGVEHGVSVKYDIFDVDAGDVIWANADKENR